MADIAFDPVKHEYRIGGVIVPGVTHICRFIRDTGNVPRWTLDAAAERGRKVHEYCELYDYGALPDEIEYDYAPYVRAYIAFLRDYRIKEWLHSEHIMGSWARRYAGTADRIGYIDGKLCIVDLKTTSALDKRCIMAQLEGYRWLFETESGLAVKRMFPVQLKKDGTYTVPRTNYGPHEYGNRLFDAALKLHEILEEKV
jgi:hypothetical protein